MLKYFDFARHLGAGITCPICHGTHCRQSRWHSKQEKQGAEGFRPYRCDDCAHRFLAPNDATLERTLINGAAGIMLVIGALSAAVIWSGLGDAPADEYVEPDLTLTTEQLAEDVELLRTAAANGHVGAMVQLGRDLASGEKIPKNVKQAAEWIRLAASTGDAEGMFELGRFYRDGIGLTQNSVRAYVWFSRAAGAHHRKALEERAELARAMSAEKLKEARHLALAAEPKAEIINPK